jgi:hypothetical protein
MVPATRSYALGWPVLFLAINGAKLLLQVLMATCSIQLVEKQGSFSSWAFMLISLMMYQSYVYLRLDQRILNPQKDAGGAPTGYRFIAPLMTLVICWLTTKENWGLSKVNVLDHWYDFAHLFTAIALIKGIALLNMLETLFSAGILKRMSTLSKITVSIFSLLAVF